MSDKTATTGQTHQSWLSTNQSTNQPTKTFQLKKPCVNYEVPSSGDFKSDLLTV